MGIVRCRTAGTNDAMEVRRRECQAVEVRRQLTHTGVPVIQILQEPSVGGFTMRSEEKHTTR